jgi:acid stress-induced BolA-like protein IbaG/YrbA
MDPLELQKAIESALPGAKAEIRDYTGTGDHFEAIVISELFRGKSRVACHQLVMNSVREFFSGPLHAFTLKTYVDSNDARRSS